MHILVMNDEGVHAPGLLPLVQAMRQCGRVSVVAPDRTWVEREPVKIMGRPLHVQEVGLSDGSPAFAYNDASPDYMLLAVKSFVAEPIDLVVSGISPTANLGHEITTSGTVKMVMERNAWNIPGIAFAVDAVKTGTEVVDYAAAAQMAQLITCFIMRQGLLPGIFFNVNIPYLAAAALQGVQLTRQGLRVHHIWLNGKGDEGVHNGFSARNSEEGTDVAALARGYVSITPLQLNITTAPTVSPLAEWDWSELVVTANPKARPAFEKQAAKKPVLG